MLEHRMVIKWQNNWAWQNSSITNNGKLPPIISPIYHSPVRVNEKILEILNNVIRNFFCKKLLYSYVGTYIIKILDNLETSNKLSLLDDQCSWNSSSG